MEFYPGKGDEKEEAAVGLQENDSTSFLLQVVFNEHFKVRTQFELESTTVVPVEDDRRKQVRKEQRIIQQRRNPRQLANIQKSSVSAHFSIDGVKFQEVP